MERRFSQLRWKDRLRIEKMMKEGRKIREIAEALHVHNSTIYREIKRGMTWQLVDWEYVEIYCPETAERKYQENMRAKGPGLKIGSDRALAECLEHLIADEHFSPAAALAKIKETGRVYSVEISEWTLYSYIDKGIFARLDKQGSSHGKAEEAAVSKGHAGPRPSGDSIEDRAEEVKTRKTFGHWEMDTVVSAKRSRSACWS